MMQKCYVFLKIYDRYGSYITAGQQDYAERLSQIEQPNMLKNRVWN